MMKANNLLSSMHDELVNNPKITLKIDNNKPDIGVINELYKKLS